MQELNVHNLRQIDRYRWLVPRQGKMRTDGMVFLDKRLLEHIKNDKSITQVANVAWLPGIVGRSLAMPDMHQGYGFPIGGVAAFDPDMGVVSPGGVGYDINCGVRLLRSSLSRDEVKGEVENLVTTLFANVPSGVGSKQRNRKLDKKELKQVLNRGAQWAVQNGFGTRDDLLHIEESGCLDWADPAAVSERALERGQAQLGTLGSGNHFVEIGFVETVFEEDLAQGIGLFPGQVTIIIHTGSRGLGHQVCSDFLRLLQHASRKYGYELPDRELCCAPVRSPEGQKYLAAMAAAANFAFANRQLITDAVRHTFEQVFGLALQKWEWNWYMMSATISPSLKPTRWRAERGSFSCTARGLPVPFRRITPRYRRLINKPASRFLYPATWAATPTSSSAPTGPCRRPSAPPVTGRAAC